jgi:flagellar hook-associated protein 2
MTISGGISIGGLGSGLDTNAIIEALLDVERVPIDALEAKKSNEQKKASLIGTIKGYVDTLRGKAKALATMSDFLSVTASNPFENLATISASTTAAEGSHTLRVASTLATDRWAFSGVADPAADLASGAASLAFGYEGSLYTFNFGDPTQTSLNDVAAAINAGPNGGVTAQVLQTGPTGGATSYQLVLTAPEGGASHRLSAISSSGLGLTISSGVGSSSNVTTGEDAVAYIDGLRFQRESNDFSDVIAGVSIQALAPGQEFTFTISADKEAIQAKLQEFVDAYNEVITFINGQNAYSEDEGAGGLLFGDSLLRTVRGTLYNTLFGQTALQVQNDPNGFGTLTLLGIKGDRDGLLAIDAAVMNAKMDEDLAAFAELFVDSDGSGTTGGPDTGLAQSLVDEIDRITKGYTDPGSGTFYKGLFDNRQEALTSAIDRIDDEITRREDRLDAYEQQLIARFTALETVMAQLNAQQAYLANNLTNLQN